MSDTSSDDDGDIKKLQDCIDTQFINDDMFAKKANKNISNKDVVEKPKSLRYPYEENNEKSMFLLEMTPDFQKCTANMEVRVTPGFQKVMAKRLSKLCDEEIQEVVPNKRKKTLQQESDNQSGIHLFRNSTNYVGLEDNDEERVKIFNSENRHQSFMSKKRKVIIEQNQSSFIEEDDEKKKVKEAAVSAEWVLNKEGIRGWVRTVKSEVIEGKQSTNCNGWVSMINGVIQSKKKKKKKKKKKEENVVTQVINIDGNSHDGDAQNGEVKKKKKKKETVPDTNTQTHVINTDGNSCGGSTINGDVKKKKKKKKKKKVSDTVTQVKINNNNIN